MAGHQGVTLHPQIMGELDAVFRRKLKEQLGQLRESIAQAEARPGRWEMQGWARRFCYWRQWISQTEAAVSAKMIADDTIGALEALYRPVADYPAKAAEPEIMTVAEQKRLVKLAGEMVETIQAIYHHNPQTCPSEALDAEELLQAVFSRYAGREG